jgi:hypothetical protein
MSGDKSRGIQERHQTPTWNCYIALINKLFNLMRVVIRVEGFVIEIKLPPGTSPINELSNWLCRPTYACRLAGVCGLLYF